MPAGEVPVSVAEFDYGRYAARPEYAAAESCYVCTIMSVEKKVVDAAIFHFLPAEKIPDTCKPLVIPADALC